MPRITIAGTTDCSQPGALARIHDRRVSAAGDSGRPCRHRSGKGMPVSTTGPTAASRPWGAIPERCVPTRAPRRPRRAQHGAPASSRWIDSGNVTVDRHPVMPKPPGPAEARYVALFMQEGRINKAAGSAMSIAAAVPAPPPELPLGAERHRIERRVVDRAQRDPEVAHRFPRRCRCPWSARAVRRRDEPA